MKRFARLLTILCLVPGLLAFMSCQPLTEGDSCILAPAFSIASGTYETDQAVEISCRTAGASIRYTTDKTAQTLASPLYAGALRVEGDCSRPISPSFIRQFPAGLRSPLAITES